MADRVWKGVYPLSFWALPSTFAKKGFDLSTPSIKKGCDGVEKKWREKNNEYSGSLLSCQSAA